MRADTRIVLNVSNVEAGAAAGTSVQGKFAVCFVAHEIFSGWYIAKDTRSEITQQTYILI